MIKSLVFMWFMFPQVIAKELGPHDQIQILKDIKTGACIDSAILEAD
jgi:hypothetical protein